MSLSDDLALAFELADLADAITLERFLSTDLVVEEKPDLTPVSDADTAVEQLVRERIKAAAPRDSVVGEELGFTSANDSDRRWIIDPIDGTRNYVRGVPAWATLLALEVGEEVTVAVVSAPALRRRWWAGRGDGAFVDDGISNRALHTSSIRHLREAQLVFAGLEDWREVGRLDALLSLAAACWRTRGFGDFWSYMLVAEGAAEIALDPVVSLWDLAAPKLIVEEAGGIFTDLGGVSAADGGDAIATNGLVHEAALSLVGRPRA